MSTLTFLIETIREPSKIGAIGPSSRFLAQKIVGMADILKADTTIVEIGPGTGVFTKQIEKIRNPLSTFLAIERNPKLVEATKSACPGVEVYEGCASDIKRFLGYHRKEYCDTVISGIPWALLSLEDQRNLLSTITASIYPGGQFLTFAYVHGTWTEKGKQFRTLLDEFFPTVTVSNICWLNFLPAIVYSCRKG